MAGKKTFGIVFLAVGIVVLLLALFADPIGLGGSSPVFGPYQIAGTIAGVIVAGGGFALAFRT
ncbi:MAG: hypothetical protein P8186_15360 [Anaerolineae bacterium]|jgi:hypothetical protein